MFEVSAANKKGCSTDDDIGIINIRAAQYVPKTVIDAYK